MKRKNLNLAGRKLSYLDNEKPGQALVCLHGHFGCAAMFSFMENVHDGRLILLDQQGHGESDPGSSYRTADYLDDLAHLLAHEAIVKPILLGHSLGGVNAYCYAAQTGNVRLLIIEDIGTEVDCSNEFILQLPSSFASLYEAERELAKIGLPFDQYFLESIRYDGEHWKFQFDAAGMVTSQREMNGAHWQDWERITCPILLLHGTNSWACRTDNILAMPQRNPHAELIVYENAGHTLHDECREKFCADVRGFLQRHG